MDKHFIITIDTEGDNLWVPYQTETGYREITTRNALYLQRFQDLCEKHGFKTTFLTNHEMATSDDYRRFAEKGLRKKTLEIGLHTHTWNMPPDYPLPYNPDGNNAYAGDYPYDVLKEKVTRLTNLLRENFQCDVTSHRGGRWYLDNNLCQILDACGYIVDCSETPGLTWSSLIGNKIYGNDYTDYSDDVHVMDEFQSDMLQVPPTIIEAGPLEFGKFYSAREIVTKIKKKKIWLRPNGSNLNDLIYIVNRQSEAGKYLEFMIHSSELMPGGSPTFKNKASIERLYRHMEIVFSRIEELGYEGITLSDYAREYSDRAK